MFSRWVTSSYSPPDDVMSFNCNDLASGAGAERKKRRRKGMGEERNGQHLLKLSLARLSYANLKKKKKKRLLLLRNVTSYQAVLWPPSTSLLNADLAHLLIDYGGCKASSSYREYFCTTWVPSISQNELRGDHVVRHHTYRLSVF